MDISSPETIIKATETIITDLIGHYGWMFVAAIAILLFKNVVSNVLDGLMFMFGHDFDVDDIVYIGGEKKARIIRQTPTKTVFHLIETDRKLIVPNTALYNLRIEKVLPSSNEGKDTEKE
jgi:hypothetical protein|tara:strand:- start:766 stop:1125 length:360 start_codon:yes stop_codon:yes gene_type:complete